MHDTYDHIKEGDPLAKEEKYQKLFNNIAVQTAECIYFVREYATDNYFGEDRFIE